MELNNLSDEFKKKALACKNAQELFELAQAEGIELSNEQLAAVSGGFDWGCVQVECKKDLGW